MFTLKSIIAISIFAYNSATTLLLVSMNDLVKLSETCAPLERNVCVEKLISLSDILASVNLECVLVKVSDHSSVGGSLFAGVVKWSTSTGHSPGLVENRMHAII